MAAISFSGVCRLAPLAKETDRLKTLEVKSFSSGWCNQTLKFNLNFGTSSTLTEIRFGYWGDPSGNVNEDKNTLYVRQFPTAYGETTGAAPENAQIAYKDRFNAETIATVTKDSKYLVDLNEVNRYAAKTVCDKVLAGEGISDEDSAKYNIYSPDDAKELLDTINKKYREFLSAGDFLNAVRGVLMNNRYTNRKFKVRGDYDIRYGEGKGQFYKTFVLRELVLLSEDTTDEENLTLDFNFYYGKDAFDDSDYKDSGKATIAGYVRYYDSQYKSEANKGRVACPINVAVRLDEIGTQRLKKRFMVEKEGQYRVVRLQCNYINGAEKVPIELKDLSEDDQEDIKCGLITLEQYRKEHGGNIYGDRITEIRYKAFNTTERFTFRDTDYEDDDFLPPTHTAQETAKAVVSSAISNADDDDIFDI